MDEALRKLVPFAIVALVCLSGCSRCSSPGDDRFVMPTRDDFLRYNRHLFWQDSSFICYYSDSLGLNPTPSPTNLWLTVRHHGAGDSIRDGQSVSFGYTVLSLRGDTIYSSNRDGVRTIKVGHRDDAMGIDEAMLSLCHGDSATVILIPEKAFGLNGDGNKIHGRKLLRYDIHILP